MTLPVASIDPVLATLILSILVLLAGVVLVLMALKSTNIDATKQVFAVVGVLFGLLAAGGLGGLFANQAAETAAEQASTAAANEVVNEVSTQVENEVPAQVENALAAPGVKTGK